MNINRWLLPASVAALATASIAVLFLVVRRHSSVAAWLLVPYLLWVSLAGALNVAVAARNGPFG